MADPGFPVGGRRPRTGGVDSRFYISKILYVETKESGPLGGVRRARPLDPPMHCNWYYATPKCKTGTSAHVVGGVHLMKSPSGNGSLERIHQGWVCFS